MSGTGNAQGDFGSFAIDVRGLSRSYGGHTVVDGVTFGVRPGVITGFLGPNGAGKSTTMRMMIGLTPPTSGRCTVLGHDYRHLPNPGRRVGVLLDASAQHSGRTGREVLTLSAMVMGLERTRVDEVLELVGLTPAEARRRTGTYSLGMRQRLGVGHALLGDPRVLILDEPANGLDPAGIHWMRGLLRDFADGGGSILLSSHLLREIEVIADELVVIGRGGSSPRAPRSNCSPPGARSSALRTTALWPTRSPLPASTTPPPTAVTSPRPPPTRSRAWRQRPGCGSRSCAPPGRPAWRTCSCG